jgi:hypothetical protein
LGGGGGAQVRGKHEPPATILSALEDTDTVRKYLMKSDVNDNTMAALSSIANEVHSSEEREEAVTYFNGHVKEVN